MAIDSQARGLAGRAIADAAKVPLATKLRELARAADAFNPNVQSP